MATSSLAALNLLTAAARPANASRPPRTVTSVPAANVRPMGQTAAPAQTRTMGSSGASAAQNLIRAARAMQPTATVRQDPVRQAVMQALAVATGRGPQPGRLEAPAYRQSGLQQHFLTPERESQAFDQQMQAVHLLQQQISPVLGTIMPDVVQQERIRRVQQGIDAMRNDPMLPNPRLQAEQQALAAFPQIPVQQLRERTDDQLAALLDLSRKPPATATGSATADAISGSPQPATMSKGPGATYDPVDAQQYRYLGPMGWENGYPNRSGTVQVADALRDAANPVGPMGWANGYPNRSGTPFTPSGPFEHTSDAAPVGKPDDGGGGFFDTVKDNVSGALTGIYDAGEALVGSVWGVLEGTPVNEALDMLTSAASGTYEAFVSSPVGQDIFKILDVLDRGRQWNVGNVGALAYRAATQGIFYKPSQWDDDHYISLFPPLALAFEAAYKGDPELQDNVIRWHDEGYSSPSYIARAEAAGVDPSTLPPEFTGDRAVWEGLIGMIDDLPPVAKYPIRMTLDFFTDPLSMATAFGKAAAFVRLAGTGMKAAEGAGFGTKVLGTALELGGKTGEIAARAPDAIVEVPIKGITKATKGIGEVTGLFSPSKPGVRAEAGEAAASWADQLESGRASVPDQPMREAFDAEAQGVTPTSGPVLIDATPSAGEAAPTPRRVDTTTGEILDTPAAPSGEVTGFKTSKGSTYEIAADGTTIRTKSLHAGHDPSDVGLKPKADQTLYFDDAGEIAYYRMATRRGLLDNPKGQAWLAEHVSNAPKIGWTPYETWSDGTRHVGNVITEIYTKEPVGATAKRGGATATDTATKAAPTANERKLADVTAQIKQAQTELKSGNSDTMMVAAEKIKQLTKERQRLRAEVMADQAAARPPVSRVERDAAAAAGHSPDTPRTPMTAERIRAASSAPPKKPPMTAAEKSANPNLAKAVARAARMNKEDATGGVKKVNDILRPQKPGEHEFSPVYNGHRPLDQIVTKAIDSKDPALMKRAEELVKHVDASVEKNLRPDPFYKTWKNGGAPVYLQNDPRYTKDFFDKMETLGPRGLTTDHAMVAKAVGLPEPAPGMTRLYRIERTADAVVPDYIFPTPGSDVAEGRWFLDDPKEMAFYIEDRADASGRVDMRYIDLPTSDVDAYRVYNVAKEVDPATGVLIDPEAYSGRLTKEFFISRDMADSSVKMTRKQADALNDLSRARANIVGRPGGVEMSKSPIIDLDRRRKALANGLAKKTLDDIAELQFNINHLLPMIAREFPEEFTLKGALGQVGRIEGRNFQAESAEWLIREYIDNPDINQANAILKSFLTGDTELPVIADGIHKPYAHSIVSDYHAESIARLTQLREQWTKLKRGAAITEVDDSMFRPADVAAQLAGGSRQASKALAASLAKTTTPSDAKVLLAIGEIKDPEIAHILLKGDGKMTEEAARGLDRAMPAGWAPPGYKGPKTEWNVKDALDWAREQKYIDPAFDHNKAVSDIGQLAAGLQPKMTPAELKSARAAAKAEGIDPKTITDGRSMMERATATKVVRGWDFYLRQWRSLRLFNPIIGLPNRLQDVLGNAVAMAGPGGNPIGALKSIPLSFTETRAYRDLARDPAKLMDEWVKETPQMMEWGMTYPPDLLKYSKLQDAGLGDALPPLQGWLETRNAPRGVKWLSHLWTEPYFKDVMVSSEMVGRKITFDHTMAQVVKREALPNFMAEIERRFPGQVDQIMNQIMDEAGQKGGRSWNGKFSFGDVKAAVDEDLARKWQRELNAAAAKGEKQAEHLFFKGGMTNADEIARRTFTFHYWMVRSSALYGRWILRNPILLSGFYRIYEKVKEIAREQELPPYIDTMLKFFTIPGMGSGYAAMDPIGLIFPTFVLDAASQEGNKFQAFQNMLVPPLSGALGALGITQNTPDLTGTRNIERFFIDLGNFMKGEGVPLNSIPGIGQFFNEDGLTLAVPTEEFAKWLIGGANDILQRAGVSVGDFTPFDRTANEQDQLFSIGEEIGMGLWGPDISTWTPQQKAELAAAVHQAQYGDGEETWLSEQIRSTYGREGVTRAGASLVIPGGVVTRQEFRDDQISDSRKYWNDFYAGKPTTKEGENAAAARSMATSANPVWVALSDEYHNIGTKEQQQQYTLFNNMRYSPEELNPNATIIINNGDGTYTFYTMRQLSQLSEDDRKTVLAAWMADNPEVQKGYETVKSGRDQFEADHPDFGQYTTYQSGVLQYPGGPSQFRKDMYDNPTFKAAEEQERQRLKKEGKSGAVLEAELDHWAASEKAFFAATGQKYKNTDTIKGTPGPSSVLTMRSLRPEESKGSDGGEKKEPKDPNVDDYWGPEKGIARLEQDQTQFEYDNQKMERRYGYAWNEQTGDWEDWADTAKERDKAGIDDSAYVKPTVSETMRRYEEWEASHPGGTPEEFFDEMLKTPGFGVKVGGSTKKTPALPGGSTVTSSMGTGSAAQAIGMLAGRGGASGVTREPVTAAMGVAAPAKPSGKLTIFHGKAFPLSQDYGMTDFAASQSGPGGMYDYTNAYTTDGSYVGHMGVDIATPLGTPLYAPVSGTVVQAGGVDWEQDDRYGSQPGTGGLRIELPNGDIVVMAHMQEIDVQVGDTVTVGQPVGYSGTAGTNGADPGGGAHVHVEYRQYAPGQTSSGYLAVDPRTKLDLGV